jgi:hypothetical protein
MLKSLADFALSVSQIIDLVRLPTSVEALLLHETPTPLLTLFSLSHSHGVLLNETSIFYSFHNGCARLVLPTNSTTHRTLMRIKGRRPLTPQFLHSLLSSSSLRSG